MNWLTASIEIPSAFNIRLGTSHHHFNIALSGWHTAYPNRTRRVLNSHLLELTKNKAFISLHKHYYPHCTFTVCVFFSLHCDSFSFWPQVLHHSYRIAWKFPSQANSKRILKHGKVSSQFCILQGLHFVTKKNRDSFLSSNFKIP